MTRPHRPTSKAAEAYIKPYKPSHSNKIRIGLENLKVGGTFEEIALASGLEDDQVWKRLSEMERNGVIYNTGLTRRLKSGAFGTVWQVIGLKYVDSSNPKTDSEVQQLKEASIPINDWFEKYQDGAFETPTTKQGNLF